MAAVPGSTTSRSVIAALARGDFAAAGPACPAACRSTAPRLETSADGPVTSVDVRRRPRSVADMRQADWAEQIAREFLEIPLPRRWAHTRGVAARARVLAPILGEHADLLQAAAWLHDIGYAPRLAVTGFHPLDGARYLRDRQDAGELLCRLVAHHSCAATEAEERDLSDALIRAFPPPRGDLLDALTYCDMTVGPDGQELTVETRLAEIRSRYGPGHLVTRAIGRSSPCIIEAVDHIRAAIA